MVRPVLIERQAYRPNLPVEEFIVPLLKARIERILADLPQRGAEFKVLDVGCGGQPFRPVFEARGYTYVSADAQDPKGIVDYVCELDGQLPDALMACGRFDFILCTEVLEHIANWERAFENFERLLQPGGRLLLTCPHFYVLHEQPYDFWRPTIHAIRYFGTRYGMVVNQLEAAGDAWDVLGTTLGACRGTVQPVRPGVLPHASARALGVALKLAYRVLQSRFLQAQFRLGSERYPLYLSNVALLTRQAQA